MRYRLPEVALVALTLLFAAACAAFVRQPTLASLADDSVSYLVMAQVFSPLQPATPAVAAAFAREAFYPPLFPLVLALTGAAHDFARAHVVSALLLAGALPLAYLLGARWLESRWAALLATTCTALLPALWVNAKGILSEPLFCLLLVAILLALEAMREGRARTATLALLMAALVLTRTAGLAPVGAYALWAVLRGGTGRWSAAAPALAAILAYGVWLLLRPTPDENIHLLAERMQGLGLGASIAAQAKALAEAWAGGFVLFWVEGQPVRLALTAVVGALALGGLALRVHAGKPDGWMLSAYLALYLAWPFSDQMGRFLFPAMPVLVLHAFLGAAAAMRAAGRPEALAHAILGLLVLALTAPAMAFVQQRAATTGRQAEITDWYRTPGLEEARRRAAIHLALYADMDKIRELTRPGERVMWVVPSYLALLADRHGLRAPPAALAPQDYRRAVEAARPDYVFLSAYHPRYTIDDGAWRAGRAALEGYGRTVYEGKGTMLIKAAR